MKTENAVERVDGPLGWIGYDAECPFCRGVRSRTGPALARRGFVFVPLQDPQFAARLGVDPRHPHVEMKLVLADGAVLGGAGAWLRLAAAFPWLAPLAWAGGLPGIRPLSDALYRAVAARRQCLGDLCPVRGADGIAPRHRHATTFFESP